MGGPPRAYLREVSWRSTSLLLQLAAREGLDVGALTADLGVSVDALAGGPGRFDWDLWVELVGRLERMVGADKLERFGARANEAAGRHSFKAVARLVSSPARLAVELCARFPGLAVLFVSGYATDEIVERGFLDTQPNLLPKPFSPEALASRVREMLDGKRRGLRANRR